jgi:hypothetical protein
MGSRKAPPVLIAAGSFRARRPRAESFARAQTPWLGTEAVQERDERLLFDEVQALVTSASFTDRGQTRNIEMGVLVDDPALATRLVHQWRGLIESGLVTRT